MSNHSQQTREAAPSFFPPNEGPSFCSLPTPVVPAPAELRAFGADSVRPQARSSEPAASPSSRPTYVPDDYVEPRIESLPSVTIGEASALDDRPLTEELEPIVAPAPPPPVPTIALAEPRLPTTPARVLFARVLFGVLFGAVALLLACAYVTRAH